MGGREGEGMNMYSHSCTHVPLSRCSLSLFFLSVSKIAVGEEG